MAFGSSGGLFGNTNSNTSGGSIFGSNANKTGGLFGNTSTTTSGSGGLFGNTNSSSSSGGLFGNTNTNTSGGLFGNTNKTSGGLFGNTNTSSSGGLFGNSSSTGGGLFGSSNTNKSGGLFGNTNTNSGGLFGSSNTNTSGGLFGNKNTSSSGGLFGNTNTSSSGGLFGNTNTSGGLFGNTSSSGGLFGNTTNNNSSGFAFNRANPNQSQNPELIAQEILASYTPGNSKFRFQTVMYIQAQPTQIAQYQKPPELTTEQWERAIRDKPEPDCVPVVIKGFDQLKHRVDNFEAGKKSTEVMLSKIKQKIAKMKQDHEAHISNIAEAKKRQFALSHRLLKLLRQLAKLRAKNTPLSPEEAMIERRLKDMIGPSRKLDMLSATRDQVDDILSNMPRQYQSSSLVPDDANMLKIFQFLSKQQEDIGKLLQMIAQDLKKAEKMIQT